MANNQEPIRRNDVIRCEQCGEDYSVTYKRCPFCEDVPNRPRRVEGGRRVAGGTKRPPNPLQIAMVAGSVALIIAALYIIFNIISPLLTPKQPGPSTSSPSVSQPAVSTPSSSGGDVSTPVEPTVIPANSITLDESDFTLHADQFHQINVTTDPANATVVWTSSNENAATVSQDGTVVNVNTGSSQIKVTITATSGDKSATCTVYCRGGSTGTVTPPSVTDPDPNIPTTTPDGRLAVGASGKITNASSGLNVRSGPGSSYERIASLSNGVTVKILDNSNDGWYKISYSGIGGRATEGYVSMDYVTGN